MRASAGYKRALLKISGEALSGDRGFGWDPQKVAWIAGEIAHARQGGRELAVVVGGGNILRGGDSAALGVSPLLADGMGMIATVLNAMALSASLERLGVPAQAMSAFPVGSFVPLFDLKTAISAVSSGVVVVFGGGTGNPCFTTDSAAALRAVELDANVMIKGTQVSGVFDRDPKEDAQAIFFPSLTTDEVLARRLRVIDATSIEILGRKHIPIIVLDLHREGNLARAVAGEKVGTLIEPV